MKFSNGKMYVGKSTNLANRLTDHFCDFIAESRKHDWHDEIKELLYQKHKENKNSSIISEFYKNIDFYIQYTSTLQNAEELEKKMAKEEFKKDKIDKNRMVKFC